jgi:hypothetical protein
MKHAVVTQFQAISQLFLKETEEHHEKHYDIWSPEHKAGMLHTELRNSVRSPDFSVKPPRPQAL